MDRAKAPGIVDLKSLHIVNMGRLKIDDPRELSRRSKSKFMTELGIKKLVPSIKPGMGVDIHDPTKVLLNEELIGCAIWACLKNGDSEGVIEVIQIHLEARNKTQLAKQAHLPKTTLYHSFRSKNLTIKILAKLVHACI